MLSIGRIQPFAAYGNRSLTNSASRWEKVLDLAVRYNPYTGLSAVPVDVQQMSGPLDNVGRSAYMVCSVPDNRRYVRFWGNFALTSRDVWRLLTSSRCGGIRSLTVLYERREMWTVDLLLWITV